MSEEEPAIAELNAGVSRLSGTEACLIQKEIEYDQASATFLPNKERFIGVLADREEGTILARRCLHLRKQAVTSGLGVLHKRQMNAAFSR